MNHGISFALLSRISADLPWYDYDSDKNAKHSSGKHETIALTDENAAQWEDFFKNLK